jgi:putative endonuclease
VPLKVLTRGERTEQEAAAWLVSRGDRIIARRFETPFAEIDILALRPNGSLLMVEVKSSFGPDDRGLGLGFKQRNRLAKAAFWISCETGRSVEISLVGKSTHCIHFLESPIF